MTSGSYLGCVVRMRGESKDGVERLVVSAKEDMDHETCPGVLYMLSA